MRLNSHETILNQLNRISVFDLRSMSVAFESKLWQHLRYVRDTLEMYLDQYKRLFNPLCRFKGVLCGWNSMESTVRKPKVGDLMNFYTSLCSFTNCFEHKSYRTEIWWIELFSRHFSGLLSVSDWIRLISLWYLVFRFPIHFDSMLKSGCRYPVFFLKAFADISCPDFESQCSCVKPPFSPEGTAISPPKMLWQETKTISRLNISGSRIGVLPAFAVSPNQLMFGSSHGRGFTHRI